MGTLVSKGCWRVIAVFVFTLHCLGVSDSVAQCDLLLDATDASCYGASDGQVSVSLSGGGSGGGMNCQSPSLSPESCASGCTLITDNSDVNASSGSYCIVTNNYSGAITVGTGSKVILCGDAAAPRGIYLNGGELVVNNELIIDTLYYWSISSQLKNYGNISFTSSITFEVTTENHGSIQVAGNIATGFNNSLVNYGTINGTGNYMSNNSFTNYGTLQISGAVLIAWNKTFENNCTIAAAGITSQGTLVNNGLITNTGNYYQEGGGYVGSAGSEITIGGNLTMNSGTSFEGTGASCSSVRLTGNGVTTINSGVNFSGLIRLCDPNGVENNYGGISGTYLNCDCEISNSECTYEWRNSSNMVVGATATVNDLPAGIYTVTATCSECPNSPLVEYVDIDEPASMQLTLTPSPASCQNNNLGGVALSVSGGTAPYIFNWNNGSYSTRDLIDAPAGKYKVTVTDDNLCSKTDSTEIASSGISLSYVKTDATCAGPIGGTITLNVAGGSAPYTYVWNHGPTVRDLTDLEAGTYSVTVSDQDGCQASASITIDGADGPGLTGAIASESCSSKGSIDLTVSGGVAPYTYRWSNGATIQDIGNLEAGDYLVQVTDARGCVSSHMFTVPADFPFEVEVDYTNSTAYGANDGTATVVVDGAGSSGPACPPAATTSENCSSCTNTISSDNGTLVVNGGKTCITASSFNSSITINAGELVICGKATPAGFTFNGGSVTVIGELVIPSAIHIYNNLVLSNYGTVTSSGIELSGNINNHGAFGVNSGNILIYSGGVFANTGAFTIATGRLVSSGSISNSGPLTVAKGIESHQTGVFANDCTINADSLISHAGFTNNGSITVNVLNIPNPGSSIELGVGSGIYAGTAVLNGILENNGSSCALTRTETHMTINNGTSASGLISLCNQGTLTNNASGLGSFLNCDCVLSSGSCAVSWSNSMTGDVITGLSPGDYTATIACGSCVVTRAVTIREEGLLIINTEHVDEAEYIISVPGLEPVHGRSGAPESEDVLEPLLPIPGKKEKALLTISGGEDHSPLEILVEFDHHPSITAVQAKIDGRYMDISPEYYTVQDGNKLYFYNDKPVAEPYIISTNLVNGLKLDPATETLEISMPSTTVFSSVLMGVNKIEEGVSVQVVAPGSALTWNASEASAGLYEFTLQLSDPQTTRTYKGQFIIE